jgi:hypothetical protein
MTGGTGNTLIQTKKGLLRVFWRGDPDNVDEITMHFEGRRAGKKEKSGKPPGKAQTLQREIGSYSAAGIKERTDSI